MKFLVTLYNSLKQLVKQKQKQKINPANKKKYTQNKFFSDFFLKKST